jgi:spermidine/putrescine transport system substrate-binding protein
MTTQDPMFSTIAASLSRRRLLQAAGVGGAAMVAAACGAKPAGGGASASGTPSPATQPDKSDEEKVANWSTWVAYIDIDDDTGTRPSLERFQEETGIQVKYTEDVNDNNEFYAKVRPQLEKGQDIQRDLIVLTDWMAAKWISSGYTQMFDKANVPNASNLIPKLQGVEFDPNRDYTLPWQSGFAGLGYNRELVKELTGKDELKTVEDLWDPNLKGRVTVLSEMRDTMGVIMGSLGIDITNFTEDQFNQGIEELQRQIDAGQIRQVTGNDYLAALENKDVVAAIGWSGDVAALGGPFEFTIPESGGTLWTDNMFIPAMAAHKMNAEKIMNFYYDPVNAAEVAAYVQYICPVEGSREAIAEFDPELVDNQFIFPDESTLSQVKVFMTLTDSEAAAYDAAFQSAIGA